MLCPFRATGSGISLPRAALRGCAAALCPGLTCCGRDQFVKNGLQKGDKITLWCSMFMLARDEGITALAHRSCIVNDVDRWERGNVSSNP